MDREARVVQCLADGTLPRAAEPTVIGGPLASPCAVCNDPQSDAQLQELGAAGRRFFLCTPCLTFWLAKTGQ